MEDEKTPLSTCKRIMTSAKVTFLSCYDAYGREE
jgi:hypothetical protein